jgi:hypothetical protein
MIVRCTRAIERGFMKILMVLLLMFSFSVHARVVSPQIDEAFNYKVESEKQDQTKRKVASEPEQEIAEDEQQSEDQEREVASEEDVQESYDGIRFWKY